jgi:hypothetical protein
MKNRGEMKRFPEILIDCTSAQRNEALLQHAGPSALIPLQMLTPEIDFCPAMT